MSNNNYDIGALFKKIFGGIKTGADKNEDAPGTMRRCSDSSADMIKLAPEQQPSQKRNVKSSTGSGNQAGSAQPSRRPQKFDPKRAVPRSKRLNFPHERNYIIKQTGHIPDRQKEFAPAEGENIVYYSECSVLPNGQQMCQTGGFMQSCLFEDSGKKNRIKQNLKSRLLWTYILFRGDNNLIELGNGSRLNPETLMFYGNNNILALKEDVKVEESSIAVIGNDNCITISDNAEISNCCIEIRGSGCKITIGEACKANDSYILITGGNNCEIKAEKKSSIYTSLVLASNDSDIKIEEESGISNSVVHTSFMSGEAVEIRNKVEMCDFILPKENQPVNIGKNSTVREMVIKGGTNTAPNSQNINFYSASYGSPLFMTEIPLNSRHAQILLKFLHPGEQNDVVISLESSHCRNEYYKRTRAYREVLWEKEWQQNKLE